MKCNFENFNGLVRGTISKKGNTRLVAKVINGEQRLYAMEIKPRATLPSRKELAQRQRFADANQFLRNMTPELKKQYVEQWRKHRLNFLGKKYNTFRGYVIARYLAEH